MLFAKNLSSQVFIVKYKLSIIMQLVSSLMIGGIQKYVF